MVVNDDAGSLNARIVWKSIVGTPPEQARSYKR